jgi:hypothetical protein
MQSSMTQTQHFRMEVIRRPTSNPKPPTDSQMQVSGEVLGRLPKRTLLTGIWRQSRPTGSPFRIRNGLLRHNGTVRSPSEYSTTDRSALSIGSRPPSEEHPKTQTRSQMQVSCGGSSIARSVLSERIISTRLINPLFPALTDLCCQGRRDRLTVELLQHLNRGSHLLCQQERTGFMRQPLCRVEMS